MATAHPVPSTNARAIDLSSTTNDQSVMSTTPSPGSGIRHQESRLLYLLTRTPLHVGAGASVGAIDQPIQRERHTGFPIIPGSTLKGVFADEWTEVVDKEEEDPDHTGQKRNVRQAEAKPERDWLFGKEAGGGELTAGALQFGEARLLAFPVRSARGSFAWLTSPLLLARAARDGVLDNALIPPSAANLTDEQALLLPDGPLGLKVQHPQQPARTQVVLEEYVFTLPRSAKAVPADVLAENAAEDQALKKLAEEGFLPLLPGDEVWKEIAARLVVVSDGMMSFFATTACEVAQHVTIDDATGTAKNTGLFNQENVPSEALFYAVVHALGERAKHKTALELRSAPCAVGLLANRVRERGVFQFGADASTGLGYCTVRLATPIIPAPTDVSAQPPADAAAPANPSAPAHQPTTNT